MLLDNVTARVSFSAVARGLIAVGALIVLTGCFPGATEQDQSVIVADIAAEPEAE